MFSTEMIPPLVALKLLFFKSVWSGQIPFQISSCQAGYKPNLYRAKLEDK